MKPLRAAEIQICIKQSPAWSPEQKSSLCTGYFGAERQEQEAGGERWAGGTGKPREFCNLARLSSPASAGRHFWTQGRAPGGQSPYAEVSGGNVTQRAAATSQKPGSTQPRQQLSPPAFSITC